MKGRLLIDECLSPQLVSIAVDHGYDATHARYMGLAAASDWRIASFVEGTDYIFATNNARDFLRLYEKMPIHNGLIVILPSVRAAEQCRLLAAVLDHLDSLPDLINKCLAIDIEGVITLSELHA